MIYLKLGQGLFGLASIYPSSAILQEISPVGLVTDRQPWKVYDQNKQIPGLKVEFAKANPGGYGMHEVKPGYTMEDIKFDPEKGISVIDMSDEKAKRQAAWDSARIVNLTPEHA